MVTALNHAGISEEEFKQRPEPSENRDLSSVPLSPENRTCLVTGASKAKDEMIRFVVAPDDIVVPDIACCLPGRGLWVSATRQALEQAAQKNPFSKAAHQKVTVIEDMPALVEKLIKARCLQLLGLAKSAGIVVVGQAQVETSKNKLSYLILANDAGGDGRGKMGYFDLPICQGLARDELGAALGHEHLVYLGIKPHNLGEKLRKELERLRAVTCQNVQ